MASGLSSSGPVTCVSILQFADWSQTASRKTFDRHPDHMVDTFKGHYSAVSLIAVIRLNG